MSKVKDELSFFIVGILLISTLAYGQSPNDTLQYRADLDFSGRKISGTFNQVVAGAGFKIALLYKNWHLENTTSYRYNKTNERVIEDNWHDLVTLKYYPKANRKLYPGVFYHFDNNIMFRVKSRHQYGIGLGSELDMGKMQLSILAGIAKENSNYNGADFVNSERDFSSRNNGLFLLKFYNGCSFAKKKINCSYQVFYFQSLQETADYDLWLSSRISYKIGKGLSFHIIYDYRFENVHLESLSNFNDIVLLGFNWSLENS